MNIILTVFFFICISFIIGLCSAVLETDKKLRAYRDAGIRTRELDAMFDKSDPMVQLFGP